MSDSYAIVRIEKYSSTSAIGRVEKHNERQKSAYKSNPDVDTSRSSLNYHLITPDEKYNILIDKRIREVNVKRLRKDSVRLQDAIVTASPYWLARMSPEHQKEYFQYALDFFVSRYGKENFVSAVVHMDEKTPHMHFSFIPITPDGRLSSKTVIGGPVGMSKLQNEFFDYMKEKYRDLDRGVPKRLSNRKHLPTSTFKEVAELTGDLQSVMDSVGQMHILNMDTKKLEVLRKVNEFGQKVADIQSKVNSNEDFVNSSKQRTIDCAKVITHVQEENKDLESRIEELEEENYKLISANRKAKRDVQFFSQYKDLYEDLVRRIKQIPQRIRIEFGLELPDRGRDDR